MDLKAWQVAEHSGEPSSAYQRVLARPVAKPESAAIGALLTKSALRRPSSVELGWKNFAVERRTTMPVEKPERMLGHHFLILWDAHAAEGEIAERSGRFAPYKKFPNTITACPPGIMPATRGANEHEVIVGALNADFVEALEAEADTRPHGSFQTLRGTDDPDLRNLLLASAQGIQVGQTSGRPVRRLVDDRTWDTAAVRLAGAKAAGRREGVSLATSATAPRVGSHARRNRARTPISRSLPPKAATVERISCGCSEPRLDSRPIVIFWSYASQRLKLYRQSNDAAHRHRPGLRLLQSRSPHDSFSIEVGVTPSAYRRDLELSEEADDRLPAVWCGATRRVATPTK